MIVHFPSKIYLRNTTLFQNTINIRTLATDIFIVLQKLFPPKLNEVFAQRNFNYNLRGNNLLIRRRVMSVRCGTETMSFLGPITWDILPNEIKTSETLYKFKAKIKS